MTPLEQIVEAVNAHLPEYSVEETCTGGAVGCRVYLHYAQRFEKGDEPDTVDRVILAGEELRVLRKLVDDLQLQRREDIRELARRNDLITKLVERVPVQK